MAFALIGVGSNIAPEDNILRGLAMLADEATIIAVSTFLRTAPLDRPDQDGFLNGAVIIETDAGPRRLKQALLRRIEDALGRKRSSDPHAARVLDLDIVAYGSERDPATWLVLDADVETRPFVAAAAAEIAPGLLVGMGEPVEAVAERLGPGTAAADAAFTERLTEHLRGTDPSGTAS